MTVIALFGAKGGVGASLLAANLGLGLAKDAPTLLVDLAPGVGSCDLLLELDNEKSWAHLLPVAGELRDRHLELTAEAHSSGLALLAAPQDPTFDTVAVSDDLERLLRALAEKWAWLVLDTGSGAPACGPATLRAADQVILVTTPDPPALRAASRWVPKLKRWLDEGRLGLALNQVGSGHPASPQNAAQALEIPLVAVLPLDRSAAGEQVHFGRPAVLQRRSRFGAAVRAMSGALVGRSGATTETASERVEIRRGR